MMGGSALNACALGEALSLPAHSSHSHCLRIPLRGSVLTACAFFSLSLPAHSSRGEHSSCLRISAFSLLLVCVYVATLISNGYSLLFLLSKYTRFFLQLFIKVKKLTSQIG
jgi:hypothetical protein